QRIPDVRRWWTLSELWNRVGGKERAQPVVETLVSKRLLVIEGGGPAGDHALISLIHDRLITEWDDLKTWLAHDREFSLWRHGVAADISRWLKGLRECPPPGRWSALRRRHPWARPPGTAAPTGTSAQRPSNAVAAAWLLSGGRLDTALAVLRAHGDELSDD